MSVVEKVCTMWSGLTSKARGQRDSIVENTVSFVEGTVSFITGGIFKRIYLVTWNVHGTKPPSDLSDLLSLNERPLPDIYAIGLQEVGSASWDAALINVLKNYDFVRVKTRRVQGICTILFVKRNHLPYVTSIESEVTKTGLKGVWGGHFSFSLKALLKSFNIDTNSPETVAQIDHLGAVTQPAVPISPKELTPTCQIRIISTPPVAGDSIPEVNSTATEGNKGAASVRLDFHGMNVIIVNSHLTPHMEGVKDRIMNIDTILDSQKFRDEDTDNIIDHDYIFWIGDLNFRVENTSHRRAVELIRNERYDRLLQNDQLRMVMEEGLVFEDFQEQEIKFAPTYKFDANTDSYDTSAQQRIPSYTDRILYYFHNTQYGSVKLAANCVSYRSHPNYRISDHKPVTAVIDINVMPTGHTGPVTFNTGKRPWNKFGVNNVYYTIRKGFTASSWDWIGLYVSNFVDLSSHVKYIWASASTIEDPHSTTVHLIAQFTQAQLFDLADGEYVLCYLTRKGSLCGISNNFTIRGI